MVYVSLAIALLVLILLCCYRNKTIDLSRNTRTFLILFFAICALIMGFRGSSVGVDTSNYIRYFNIYKNSSFLSIFSSSQIEVGYAFFMKLCSMICGDYIFFQIIISILICFGMAKFIYDNSDYAIFVTIIFLGIGLYTRAFNVTRQAFAVMLVANSWTCLMNKKYARSLILTIIATLMHSSAIIFLITYIIYIFRKNRYFLWAIIIIAVLCAINYRAVISFFSNYISRFSSYYGNNRGTQSAGLVQIIWVIILIFSLYLVFNKNISIKDRMIAILSIFYVICNFVSLFFNYFERVGLYFIPAALLLFDSFGKYFGNKNTKRIYYVGASSCFLIFFLISSLSSSQFVYTTFWAS